MNCFKCLLVMLLMCCTDTVFAINTVTGIYLTCQDYQVHKLSYTEQGNKIALNEFFEQSYITISTNNTKQRLSKSAVYGYRQNDHDYRFFKDKGFCIIDTVGFYLYTREKIAPSGKKLSPTQFFSSKGDNGILPLTLQNISWVFAKDHAFKYRVMAQFKTDNELMEYDDAEKRYKLKEVYLDNRL